MAKNLVRRNSGYRGFDQIGRAASRNLKGLGYSGGYYSFEHSDKDMKGDSKADWMYEKGQWVRNEFNSKVQEHKSKIWLTEMDKRLLDRVDVIAEQKAIDELYENEAIIKADISLGYYGFIGNAVSEGKFDKAIKERRMTTADAKRIIDSAGIDVPKNIADSVKRAEAKSKKLSAEQFIGQADNSESKKTGGMIKTATMADTNPFIGDNYFKLNPDKVLGEQYEDRGQFGNVIIKVRGSLDNIQRIDATPVAVVDFYPQAEYTDESKKDIIQQIFQKENELQNKNRIDKIRTASRKKNGNKNVTRPVQEIYTFREVGEIYNKNVTRDELEAYYFTNPQLNQKLLFDDFTNYKEDFIDKGLICYDEGKFVYYYTYISGNVNKKISNLKRDRDRVIAAIGEMQYERQLQMLMDVRPKAKGFVGDEKIILLPHSNFAKQVNIQELRTGKPQLYREMSLFEAFKAWIRTLPPDSFNRSNYKEITDYYLDNKPLPAPTKYDSAAKAQKIEKNNINIRQRTKEEGDALFAKFLEEELLPEDQAKVSYLWNEKFNSIVEPQLEKIPVCFEVSKTWKNNAPFKLNDTQRQAVAFMQEKRSGLLAYGVGVGKTQAAILNFGNAYYNGLANIGCCVVPTNTYDNWLGEIQGYVDKNTGEFMQGTMPQLPPVLGLFNLNPVIVREKLKSYTEDEEQTLESIQHAISELKSVKGALTADKKKEISEIYPINWGSLSMEFESGQDSGRYLTKSFADYAVSYLTAEYNYNIYSFGEIKPIPHGTIIVITEVGLQRLGVSDENKVALTSRMYSILSQGESADETPDSRRAKDVAKLQLKIEQTVSSSMKNARLTIEELGIDWVCFDEGHYYKKLFTFVKGAIIDKGEDRDGNTKYKREKSKYELKSGSVPSSRALSAFVLSHFVQYKNDNRNVVMLTATPFTNSPLEVFSMLTLTNYAALEDMGVSNMVDFFDTFMRINYDIKYTPQKTVVKDVVLTGYNNLSQLRQIIYSLMDKRDAGANLIRPNKHVWPSLQNGIETTLPMTAEQEDLMQVVKAYIQGNNEYEEACKSALSDEIENLDFDGWDDETLITEWERNTEKEYTGEREDLSDDAREKLINQIKGTRAQGVEMNEDDLEEEESLGVRILRGLSMMRQITLSPYLYYKACRKAANEAAQLPTADEYINSSPKLKYVVGCIKSIVDYHNSRNEKISGQVIYMNAGVEYFPLIKEYIVAHLGLKDSQVGIVSGKMSKTAKENVKRQFLSGDILVLIGSSTISVGVNLQDNSSTLYNCYYDWNPTDAAQIEGRIWRQGNRFADVRIVYPQCYNSADPIIFEYLNAKTLRINEIWNRSSQLQELDLRDFNPKELQKKLITDPVEKAEWEMLEAVEKVQSEIMYFENRREMLTNAMYSYRKYKEVRPDVVHIMTELSKINDRIRRDERIAKQKLKMAELGKKFGGEPEKLQLEIAKWKEGVYDYELDPENKYKGTDYSKSDDDILYYDASKYIEILDELDWSSDKAIWGDFVENRGTSRAALKEYRYNYKDMRAANERVLKPMGLTFATATNPVAELDEKIASLREQEQAIEDTKPERIERITREMAAQNVTLKSVAERVAEFAAYNPAMLSNYLIAPQAEAPHQLAPPTLEEIIADNDTPSIDDLKETITIQDLATQDIISPAHNLVIYAQGPEDKTYKAMAYTDGGLKAEQVRNVLLATNIEPENYQDGIAAVDKIHATMPEYNLTLKEIGGDNKVWYEVKAGDQIKEVIVEDAIPESAFLDMQDEPLEVPSVTEPEFTIEPEAIAEPVSDEEPPVEEYVFEIPTPVDTPPAEEPMDIIPPASAEEIIESSRQIIENEINVLTLSLDYATMSEKRQIRQEIKALKLALEYAD